MDLNGKADPYCIVTNLKGRSYPRGVVKDINDVIHTTKTQKKTLIATWNESFEINPSEIGKLTFTVKDKDLIGSDEVIGAVCWAVPLWEMVGPDPQSKSVLLPLTHTKDDRIVHDGALSITYTYSMWD